MSDLREILEHAVHEELLLATSVANILQLLSGGNNPLYRAAVQELAENNAWTELNDRFFGHRDDEIISRPQDEEDVDQDGEDENIDREYGSVAGLQGLKPCTS